MTKGKIFLLISIFFVILILISILTAVKFGFFDSVPPEISIISPEHLERCHVEVVLRAEVQDKYLDRTELYINDKKTLEYTESNICDSLTLGKDTSYTIKLKAFDKKGNWKEEDVIFEFTPDLEGSFKWVFLIEHYVSSCPAIGRDGTIYVCGCELYAINPDGSQKWTFSCKDYLVSSPAIGADGTIYVGSHDNKLYAINPDGTQKWISSAGGAGTGIEYSPAIGIEGTIYVASCDSLGSDTYEGGCDSLCAINPDGTQKWTFSTGDCALSSPTTGKDGTIYVGDVGGEFYAINPDGSQKWAFATGGAVISSPAIGTDGTIYVGSIDKNLYAINPDGTKKWAFLTGDEVTSSPAIGRDGTIYVGSNDDNLYAINPDGTQKWSFETSNIVASSPMIGADGTIYVGSFDRELHAINPDGTQKWQVIVEKDPFSSYVVSSSPSIGKDGTIYVLVSSSDSKLCAIYGSSGGLANTPWPKFRHDLKNSGRVGTP